MKSISFVISKGDIILRAKDETYLSARSALAVEVSNQEGRYEMQADERVTHERKLMQSLNDAVYGLKSELNEYIVDGDVSENNDEISFSIKVNDSFRDERVSSVRELFARYVANRIISEWWKANYPSYAAQYDEQTLDALNKLKRSFFYKGEAEYKKYGE